MASQDHDTKRIVADMSGPTTLLNTSNTSSAPHRVEEDDTNISESPLKVDWDGPDDPENPKNFALWRKWVMVFIVSFSSLCV